MYSYIYIIVYYDICYYSIVLIHYINLYNIFKHIILYYDMLQYILHIFTCIKYSNQFISILYDLFAKVH